MEALGALSGLEQALLEKARLQGGSVVFAEALDQRVLAASRFLLEQKLMSHVYLMAHRSELKAALSNWPETVQQDLCFVKDMVPDLSSKVYAQLQAAMQAKGRAVVPEELEALARQDVFQAAWLVASQQVETGVCGAVYTTAAVIQAGLKVIGLAPGQKTVSSSMLLTREIESGETSSLLFADAGVVVEPSSEQLLDIAAQSVQMWQRIMPEEPARLAFLSFSTHGSAKHPQADKMREVAASFASQWPQICCDGELQFDAATIPEIAERKCPQSPVAGRANVLIFPDLNAGNIAYKLAQRLGGYQAYGPLLQGFKYPWNDLSRGASWRDIVFVALINKLPYLNRAE